MQLAVGFRTFIQTLGLSAVLACGGGGGSSEIDAPLAIDAAVDAPPLVTCRAWAAGPYGTHRGELADDFTVTLVDNSTWSLRTTWTGCDHVVVFTDAMKVSPLEPTPLVHTSDYAALLATPVRNAQLFFVAAAPEKVTAQLDAALANLAPADAAYWSARVHVVKSTGGWLQGALATHGKTGVIVDRGQRIRGIGSLSDVNRFDQGLQNSGEWPWKNNLAYLANEVAGVETEVALRDKLAAETGTLVVPLWTGQTLEEFAETDVTLPDAAALAGYDTVEIDVELGCPDQEKGELGNCGAWDYLARLHVDSTLEVARFITPFHRGGHWVVDATHALAVLREGGAHHFRWDFAPSFNKQPTRTTLSLRFSNRSKGRRPLAIVPLYTGGALDAMYNTNHAAKSVTIPPGTTHVELVAIVTQHGSGTNQCGEFCIETHEFTIGGVAHSIVTSTAGSMDGCAKVIDHNITPNQGGTWWFGRGGWCPGQQVTPYVVDVTADVTPSTAVAYRTLFAGGNPPDGSGDIVLESWLVAY